MSALVERLIASRDRLRGFAVPSDDDVIDARQVMADAANALSERDEALRQHPSADAVIRGRYDPTKSLGERLHASYREALGHIDGERSNFARLPSEDQAFWDRAAVNFVARLSS